MSTCTIISRKNDRIAFVHSVLELGALAGRTVAYRRNQHSPNPQHLRRRLVHKSLPPQQSDSNERIKDEFLTGS
ncbi:hypothetical protein LshimejAT787_0903800 [Lyophyllum shimeji]|uniref:Uncharacterized protein n=1 Tax=Lyophyllum shimeji TaxID=47721 RepID=A0A9P3PSE3_LYOSH|nr:hypothetical protein LshimejAT787_0903800 [Lyophyllum shimeji]